MELEKNLMTDLAADTEWEISSAIRCSKRRKDAEERILKAYESSSYRLLMYKTMAAGLIRYIEEYLGKEINEDKLDDYINHELAIEMEIDPYEKYESRRERAEQRKSTLRLMDEDGE